MDRKDRYKHKLTSSSKLRERRRRQSTELRRVRRDQAVSAKRVRLHQTSEEQEDCTPEQVQDWGQKLVQKDGDLGAILKHLKTAFSQGTALIDEFFKVDNAMAALVGVLSGNDAELQLEAAWCLTNIAAGDPQHEQAVLTQAGSYLITYLASGSPALQDQCAWAVGNLAGGDISLRDTLRAQGAIPALIKLLQSAETTVLHSTLFALSNLARDQEKSRELIDGGILPILNDLLVLKKENMDIVGEAAWVLTYLAASGEHEPLILGAGILDRLVQIVVQASSLPSENYKLLTPVLRCLGNLCSRPDNAADQACESGALVPALRTLLEWEYRHIIKETLWVISNITASAPVCRQVLSSDLLGPLLHILSGSTYDIKHEVAYCLCNMASQGHDGCLVLLKEGVFPAMIALLSGSDVENTNLALAFCELMLSNTDDGLHVFEENGGLKALELLEYHANDSLRLRTNDILDTYFYKQGTTP